MTNVKLKVEESESKTISKYYFRLTPLDTKSTLMPPWSTILTIESNSLDIKFILLPSSTNRRPFTKY